MHLTKNGGIKLKKSKRIIVVSGVIISLSLFKFATYANGDNIAKEANISRSQEVKLIDIQEIKDENKERVKEMIKKEKEEEKLREDELKNGFTYDESIPMPEEHQKYLHELCKERGLDYLKTLSIIGLESNFNSNLISKTRDYGYMQINKVNHNNLTKTLKTENNPLDPYININWGTHMLEDLYNKWTAEGISDEVKEGEVFSELDKYVMSSYNKGVNGFRKNGMATRYIGLTRDKYREIEKATNQ